MTLEPAHHDRDVALGSDADHRKKPSAWNRFMERAQRLEAPFIAFGKLSGVAGFVWLLGWLLTSIIQYNSWRADHDLKKYEEELTQATKTFAEASDAFSKALTAQQLLAFNYVDALGSTDAGYVDFLWTQAHATADEYRKARTELRQTIGVMTRRAEIYIDWPSADNRVGVEKATAKDPLTAVNIDAITKEAIKRLSEPSREKSKVDLVTVSKVEGDDVDCDHLIPETRDVQAWPQDAPVRKGAATTIDWQSSKHHLIVLYACYAQDHVATEPIRRWATAEKMGQPPATPAFLPADKDKRKKLAEDLKSHFSLQAQRLDNFNILAMTRIEHIRFKNEPPGWICHTTGWLCGGAGRAARANKPAA
jgi:hypothetical protein